MPMRSRLALSLIASAIMLAACGDHKSGASQVVAKVNKEEISVHQINAVLARAGNIPEEQRKAASTQVLERLPEVCYPAQGLPITANRERPLSTPFGTIPSRQLQANSPQRSEPITYWVMVGRYATASGTERKVAQMRYGLEGKIPDGLLVRVSSISRDTEAGYKLQNAFIADMLKAMPEPQRGALIGPPAL